MEHGGLMHRPTLDERLALAAAVLRYEEALVKIESGACSKGGEASLVLAMRQIARRALAGEE
jgi:hypothetical protein